MHLLVFSWYIIKARYSCRVYLKQKRDGIHKKLKVWQPSLLSFSIMFSMAGLWKTKHHTNLALASERLLGLQKLIVKWTPTALPTLIWHNQIGRLAGHPYANQFDIHTTVSFFFLQYKLLICWLMVWMSKIFVSSMYSVEIQEGLFACTWNCQTHVIQVCWQKWQWWWWLHCWQSCRTKHIVKKQWEVSPFRKSFIHPAGYYPV